MLPSHLAALQARAGGPGFDPTVRNVQLGTARPEGYRNAVKAHDLTGLPQVELTWWWLPISCNAASAAAAAAAAGRSKYRGCCCRCGLPALLF